jgi:hypothetical protein
MLRRTFPSLLLKGILMTTPPVHAGKIEEKDLAALLTSLDFILDHGEANSSTYELIGHGSHGSHRSLTRHFRLLAPMRSSERISLGLDSEHAPRHRVLAIVWYSNYYQTGLVIEILGEDIRDYMTQKAAELISHLDHEVPIAVRILHFRLYRD